MSIPAHRDHHVYRHYDEDGALLYVGVTCNPGRRPRQRNGRPWITSATRIEVGPPQSMWLAYKEEWRSIRCDRPLYNVDQRNGWLHWVVELQELAIAQWTEEERAQNEACAMGRLMRTDKTPDDWFVHEEHLSCIAQRHVIRASYVSGDRITRAQAEAHAADLMARRPEQAVA